MGAKGIKEAAHEGYHAGAAAEAAVHDRDRLSFGLFLGDLILLNVSFFAVNYWKRGTFALRPDYYLKLLLAFNGIWLLVSLLTKKFRPYSYRHLSDGMLLISKSIIFTAYGVSLMVVSMSLTAFSRLHIYGTCVMLFIAEALAVSTVIAVSRKGRDLHPREYDVGAAFRQDISLVMLLADFALVTAAFFVMNYYKRGTFALSPAYEKVLLIIYGLWFVTSFLTGKFDRRQFLGFQQALVPCLKAFVLKAGIMSAVIFAFRMFFYSRLHVFGTFLILLCFEVILYYVYFIAVQDRAAEEDIESVRALRDFLGQTNLPTENSRAGEDGPPDVPVAESLKAHYLKDRPSLFGYLSSSIDLTAIGKERTRVLNTRDIYNVETIDDRSLRLFINLHRINDIRRINRYFLEVYKKLVNGGYFVGAAVTIDGYKHVLYDKYRPPYSDLLYGIHFTINRVFPKLPGIRKLYFAVTRGKNRIISRAETLGRLYFCGYSVVSEQEINGTFHYVAQKVRTASRDRIPSYGPFIKLQRSGLNDRLFHVYKFRTMYPYSEYLQRYVYDAYNLQDGGKIRNDFRVTEWGRFLRKFWLDEIPMIYNWIKGDVKFFGIRPLSAHYLSLYSTDIQEMRKKVKPGLIPPFYADMPVSFDDICESERRYLNAYLASPLRTQWTYFWKALLNIIVRGARSN